MNKREDFAEKFGLNFEKDIKILSEKYFDYLPEGTDREAFIKGIIKTLASQ